MASTREPETLTADERRSEVAAILALNETKSANSSTSYALPHPPLLAPVRFGHDAPNHALANRIATMLRARQEEQLLLDVGRQMKQVHDLGDTGPRDVPELGEFGLSATGKGAEPMPPELQQALIAQGMEDAALRARIVEWLTRPTGPASDEGAAAAARATQPAGL